MLAGVLIRFVMAVFESAQGAPGLVLPLVALFLVVRVFNPALAVLAVLVVGLAASFRPADGRRPLPDVWRSCIARPSFAPAFDAAGLIGLGVPLVPRHHGVPEPARLRGAAGLRLHARRSRSILAVTGVASVPTAPFRRPYQQPGGDLGSDLHGSRHPSGPGEALDDRTVLCPVLSALRRLRSARPDRHHRRPAARSSSRPSPGLPSSGRLRGSAGDRPSPTRPSAFRPSSTLAGDCLRSLDARASAPPSGAWPRACWRWGSKMAAVRRNRSPMLEIAGLRTYSLRLSLPPTRIDRRDGRRGGVMAVTKRRTLLGAASAMMVALGACQGMGNALNGSPAGVPIAVESIEGPPDAGPHRPDRRNSSRRQTSRKVELAGVGAAARATGCGAISRRRPTDQGGPRSPMSGTCSMREKRAPRGLTGLAARSARPHPSIHGRVSTRNALRETGEVQHGRDRRFPRAPPRPPPRPSRRRGRSVVRRAGSASGCRGESTRRQVASSAACHVPCAYCDGFPTLLRPRRLAAPGRHVAPRGLHSHVADQTRRWSA